MYQPILVYGKSGSYIFHPKAQMVDKRIVVTSRVKKAKPHLADGYMGRVGSIWDDITYINGGCMAKAEAILQPDSKKKAHPCQMPVALAERAIVFSTDDGAVVLDPFIGSGTTAIAAIRTGRHFIGIDLSEQYCELARERIRIERSQLTMNFNSQGDES
jgi:DNA modification methylase